MYGDQSGELERPSDEMRRLRESDRVSKLEIVKLRDERFKLQNEVAELQRKVDTLELALDGMASIAKAGRPTAPRKLRSADD